MFGAKINKTFQLNGKLFLSVDELLEYSKGVSVPIYNFLSDWFSADNFIKIKTSGSTGKPKLIQIKKEYMVNSALATGSFFDLQENSTALLCLPVDYIAGKMMLVRALVLGWKLDIVEPTSNPLEGVKKKYDFSAMIPMQLQNSLEDIYKIKKLIIGGGIVSKKLKTKIRDAKTKIFATYGMTETSTHIAVKKLNSIYDQNEKRYYTVMPDIKISKDNRNCLIVLASKISDNQIITNDIVNIISETEFEWLGRFDNVINSGGVKLHSERIEEKLSKVISQRFFVAGVEDIILGEKLILIIEKNATSINVKKSLIENLKREFKSLKSLSKFEIPREIYFLNEFVETKTKKIQRKKTLDFMFNTKLTTSP